MEPEGGFEPPTC